MAELMSCVSWCGAVWGGVGWGGVGWGGVGLGGVGRCGVTAEGRLLLCTRQALRRGGPSAFAAAWEDEQQRWLAATRANLRRGGRAG